VSTAPEVTAFFKIYTLIASARFVDSGGKFTTGVSDAGGTLFTGADGQQ
jgi:hypothetical protein